MLPAHFFTFTHRILNRGELNPTNSILLQCVYVCMRRVYRSSGGPEHCISTFTNPQKSFPACAVFRVVWVTMIKCWGVTRSRYILQMFHFTCWVRISSNYISRRSLSKNNNKNVCVKIQQWQNILLRMTMIILNKFKFLILCTHNYQLFMLNKKMYV